MSCYQGLKTPSDARAKAESQRAEMAEKELANLEEQAISLVGRDIYEKLINGYTEKQWGRKCTELPAFIIKRLPVRFETEVQDMPNYQGNAVVNWTEASVPYTRVIEHNHFDYGQQSKTVISRKYSSEWIGDEPYYPVNDAYNEALAKCYKELAQDESQYLFAGRLAEYKYCDMHQMINNVLRFKTISSGLDNG